MIVSLRDTIIDLAITDLYKNIDFKRILDCVIDNNIRYVFEYKNRVFMIILSRRIDQSYDHFIIGPLSNYHNHDLCSCNHKSKKYIYV